MGNRKRFELPHSPAPWRWADDGATLLDATGQTVVVIRDLGLDQDANLMVAAPAMAAALIQLRKELRRFGPTDEGVEKAMGDAFDALLFAKYGLPPEREIPDMFDKE